MKLLWTPEASACLARIEDHLASEASPARARMALAGIIHRAEGLPTTPRAGRKVQPENRDDLRVAHQRPYWIYYRIRHDAIEILLVWHYRQRQPKVPGAQDNPQAG